MYFKHLRILDPKSRFLKDPLQLLKDIVKKHVILLPYQNVTVVGQLPPVDRRRDPFFDFRKMIQASIAGHGGMCPQHNAPLKYHLESIGFKASLIQGCFVRTGIPNSHTLVLVNIPDKHTGKERKYIVDCGTGIPNYRPIPLDELPFTGRAGGFKYIYEWFGPGMFRGFIKEETPFLESTFLNPQNYVANVGKIVQLEDLRIPIEAASDEETGPKFLRQHLYLFRYLSINDENEEDWEAICIRGHEVITITQETRSVQRFSGYLEMEDVVQEYFPMIPQHEVKMTLKHFSLPYEEALKLPSLYPS